MRPNTDFAAVPLFFSFHQHKKTLCAVPKYAQFGFLFSFTLKGDHKSCNIFQLCMLSHFVLCPHRTQATVSWNNSLICEECLGCYHVGTLDWNLFVGVFHSKAWNSITIVPFSADKTLLPCVPWTVVLQRVQRLSGRRVLVISSAWRHQSHLLLPCFTSPGTVVGHGIQKNKKKKKL